MTAITDCCDRSIVVYEISNSDKAAIAIAALENPIAISNPQSTLILRFDNCLVFEANEFSKEARLDYLKSIQYPIRLSKLG